jgi:hypothetical protein
VTANPQIDTGGAHGITAGLNGSAVDESGAGENDPTANESDAQSEESDTPHSNTARPKAARKSRRTLPPPNPPDMLHNCPVGQSFKAEEPLVAYFILKVGNGVVMNRNVDQTCADARNWIRQQDAAMQWEFILFSMDNDSQQSATQRAEFEEKVHIRTFEKRRLDDIRAEIPVGHRDVQRANKFSVVHVEHPIRSIRGTLVKDLELGEREVRATRLEQRLRLFGSESEATKAPWNNRPVWRGNTYGAWAKELSSRKKKGLIPKREAKGLGAAPMS